MIDFTLKKEQKDGIKTRERVRNNVKNTPNQAIFGSNPIFT